MRNERHHGCHPSPFPFTLPPPALVAEPVKKLCVRGRVPWVCGTEKPAMDGCFMGRKTSWRKEGSKWAMSRMQPHGGRRERREYMQKNSRKAEVSGSSVMSVDAAWVCACMCMCVYSPRRGGIACQIRDQLVHCVRERSLWP